MPTNFDAVASSTKSVIEINKVLRNTYSLLSMTLLFSAAVAYVSMSMNLPHPGLIMMLVGFYGLMFAIHKFQNSVIGLVLTFVFTGFLGYTLGPILNMYLQFNNGGQLIASALGLTGFTFLGLSAYALTTRKDFNFLANFMVAGFFVLIGTMVLGFFVNIPGLQLAISAGFVLFSSAAILFQTGQLVNGGERNYILATVTLYVSIYNLFLSLLHILGAVSGRD
jgi:modulator of FtsH protease